MEKMKVETMPLVDLNPAPYNPRAISDAALKGLQGSVERFGMVEPVVWNKKTGHIVGGHQRVKVLQAMGETSTTVIVVDMDEIEEKALNIVLNNPLIAGEFTEGINNLLAEIAEELPEIMSLLQLDKLGEVTGLLNPEPTGADPDEVPDEPEIPVTQPGDLWQMGGHYLLCGDAANENDANHLMKGQCAALIVADPPYFRKVSAEWDNSFAGFTDFLDFLTRIFSLWSRLIIERGTSAWWCAPDYAWDVENRLRQYFAVFNHIVWTKGASLGQKVSVEDMRRWRPRSERILICEHKHSSDSMLSSFNSKTSHIAARSAYAHLIDRFAAWQNAAGLSLRDIDACLGTNGMAGHYFGRSQWCLPTRGAWEKMRPLFWGKGVEIGEFDEQRREFDEQRREFDEQRREFDEQRREFGTPNDGNLTDVWEHAAPSGPLRFGHPTPKPAALIEKIVLAHSRVGDLVADPFAGSGTTIVACEKTGRTARGLEIDPRYCDVIVKRWENISGKKAVRHEAV